jgi:hypothetical protein
MNIPYKLLWILYESPATLTKGTKISSNFWVNPLSKDNPQQPHTKDTKISSSFWVYPSSKENWSTSALPSSCSFSGLWRNLAWLWEKIEQKRSANLVHGTCVEETKIGFLERNSVSDDPQFNLIQRVRRGQFQSEIWTSNSMVKTELYTSNFFGTHLQRPHLCSNHRHQQFVATLDKYFPPDNQKCKKNELYLQQKNWEMLIVFDIEWSW